MINNVHNHVIAELENSVKSDTTIVIVAITFDLISLCINSQAALIGQLDSTANAGGTIIFVVFIVMTILFNALALVGLMVGRSARMKLLSKLIEMYNDNDVGKYYDESLMSSYGTRYLIFGAVIVILALTAIIVPLTMRLLSVSF